MATPKQAGHVLPAARAIKATQDPAPSSTAQFLFFESRTLKVLAHASPSTATPKMPKMQA
jgi:hypothetical protein